MPAAELTFNIRSVTLFTFIAGAIFYGGVTFERVILLRDAEHAMQGKLKEFGVEMKEIERRTGELDEIKDRLDREVQAKLKDLDNDMKTLRTRGAQLDELVRRVERLEEAERAVPKLRY